MANEPRDARDARVDKAITWGITTVAAIAFAWGGNAFSGLQAEVRALREEIAKQGTRISVVEEQRRIEGLDYDRRIQALERWKEQQEGKK